MSDERRTTTNDHVEVSILTCTVNRHDNVVHTVKSIQACGYSAFELLILDQSSDDSTEHALAPYCSTDPRIRYLRLSVPGKPLALNEGRGQARGRYILLTDDDCEVTPGWIDNLVEMLESDPRIGCVFGDVDAGPHDRTKGYIPVCRVTERETIERLGEWVTMPDWGHHEIGANMALRADVLTRLGGWDLCIGPGTKFGSGDDHDMAVNVLRAGYAIGFCPTARVIHHGFRYWKSARRDLGRTGFGLGAIFAKHLRCGVIYPGALRALGDMLKRSGLRALRLERPLGLAYPTGWLRGFVTGLGHPVNRASNHYVPMEEAEHRRYTDRIAEVVLREPGVDPAGKS